jgi:hypothetical protein
VQWRRGCRSSSRFRPDRPDRLRVGEGLACGMSRSRTRPRGWARASAPPRPPHPRVRLSWCFWPTCPRSRPRTSSPSSGLRGGGRRPRRPRRLRRRAPGPAGDLPRAPAPDLLALSGDAGGREILRRETRSSSRSTGAGRSSTSTRPRISRRGAAGGPRADRRPCARPAHRARTARRSRWTPP